MVDPVAEMISYFQSKERQLLVAWYNLILELNSAELEKLGGDNSKPDAESSPQTDKEPDAMH